MRIAPKSCKNILSKPKTTAAIIVPVIEPNPPSTTIIKASTDFIHVKSLGVTVPINPAYKLPAIAVTIAPSVKAITLTRVTLTPIDSEAISSSRTDKVARPDGELIKFKISMMTSTAKMKVMPQLVNRTIPDNPAAPLVRSPPFIIKIRMISDTPNVAIAR